MAIFDQKLWSEPFFDIFVWSVLKSNHSENNFIHCYVLLTCPVMKKGQQWSEKPFSGQNMAIFDQKLWADPSNDICKHTKVYIQMTEIENAT